MRTSRTVFLTALITFVAIGPVFSLMENYVLKGAKWLVQFGPGAMIMGALYPLTVVMGLHHMYNVIEAGMLSSVGLNTWMPIASAANFAQFGACLAVGIKCRQAKLKKSYEGAKPADEEKGEKASRLKDDDYDPDAVGNSESGDLYIPQMKTSHKKTDVYKGKKKQSRAVRKKKED